MRVLYLIPSMGGGGAERQLTYLCTELVRRKHQIHVALIYEGPNMERLKQSGAIIHKLVCQNNHDPRLFFHIARLINRLKPDLVHTWLTQMDVLGAIASEFANVPFIMSERNNGDAYNCGWKNKLRRFLGSRASLIISNSEGGTDYWLKIGKGRDEVKIIRNAIPFEEIDSHPHYSKETELPECTESAVFAGRYHSQKNIGVLLEAFKHVVNARPGVKANLFGEGPMKDAITDFINGNGLGDSIKDNGYNPDIWNVFKSASLFVNISVYEGSPNTVLEAVACNCPVVVSNIPAHREFLDDESAWFVPTDSPLAISKGIVAALENKDEARRRAINARLAIRNLSLSRMTEEYLEAYNNVLRIGLKF